MTERHKTAEALEAMLTEALRGQQFKLRRLQQEIEKGLSEGGLTYDELSESQVDAIQICVLQGATDLMFKTMDCLPAADQDVTKAARWAIKDVGMSEEQRDFFAELGLGYVLRGVKWPTTS